MLPNALERDPDRLARFPEIAMSATIETPSARLFRIGQKLYGSKGNC